MIQEGFRHESGESPFPKEAQTIPASRQELVNPEIARKGEAEAQIPIVEKPKTLEQKIQDDLAAIERDMSDVRNSAEYRQAIVEAYIKGGFEGLKLLIVRLQRDNDIFKLPTYSPELTEAYQSFGLDALSQRLREINDNDPDAVYIRNRITAILKDESPIDDLKKRLQLPDLHHFEIDAIRDLLDPNRSTRVSNAMTGRKKDAATPHGLWGFLRRFLGK